jgi:hypothetical protein
MGTADDDSRDPRLLTPAAKKWATQLFARRGRLLEKGDADEPRTCFHRNADL